MSTERMLAIIWMTLLFSVMGGTQRDGGGSIETYSKGWSIAFSEDLITSEAGLCVVIPCSFTHDARFNVISAIWSKCENTNRHCEPSDIIFHSKNATKAQVPFRGRVALLEPDITQGNCSISINDLQESDTGSYHFRVGGVRSKFRPDDGYDFLLPKTVIVKGLRQRPVVNVPAAVTEGHQTTLTCTAPGLCSGTPPSISWTWTKAGRHRVPHVTNDLPENPAGVSRRHSSTLTFSPSPEHHGTEVTCQVTFKGNVTTAETVTLNVTFQNKGFFSVLAVVKIIVVALMGVALFIYCLARTFHRSLLGCREKNSRDQAQSVQMVICQNQQAGGGQGLGDED